MNEIVQNIESQVKSCQNLLSIFQDERQMYQTKGAVGVSDVMKMVERKKSVMQIFEKQQRILREVSESGGQFSTEDEEKKKTLLRDLASALEQLLVIDHENEKLLRQSLGKTQGASAQRPQAMNRQQRPALLSKHPFVPGQMVKPLAGKTPLAHRSPSVSTITSAAPVANSRLRQYIQANKFGALESKYA